jgi:Kef-type K+ transport system membrane component KefB
MSSEIVIIITLSAIISLSPFISKLTKMPITPLEIILGSIAASFGFLNTDNHLFEVVAEFGFLYLMFLAGVEVDLKRLLNIEKSTLRLSVAYLSVMYLLSALFTIYTGISNTFMVIFPLISVGLIMALIKEYGKDEDWLNLSMTVGTLGEIVSIAVLTVVAAVLEFGLGFELYKTITFLILFLVSFFLLFKFLRVIFWWYPEIKEFLMPLYDRQEQDVRLSMGIFFITIAITLYLHLEVAFGGFLAGVFIATFFEHKESLPHKLESFGFGFLIPIFFVFVGASFNLNAILMDGLLLNALIIVLSMMTIRFISSLVFLRKYPIQKVTLFSLSQSMPLTLLIAVATLAYHSNSISQIFYFSFILASLFQVIISMIGIKLIIKGDYLK